ncbi:DUF2971 domain-containing protein [Steroidobacter sp. S1-65]|uniref:DUF2971 domain-containing protein n=1 Tax=Steroidobacter gossypii TaxID=2805490 RepID=A0ABS1X5W2_9GAMM|nr:DUF2971 domain-containing protein [Steroidobacter gossypii]MBM0108595.1 DUF2971 domain-containing protein [Steroidobacter gossypii]
MRLYYMTAAKWAEVILKERRLKLSRFSEANDPFELRIIDSRDRAVRKYAELICEYFEKNVGFICFGASWRSPVMWAHYAEKHSGVALGFEVPDELATKVEYTNDKIQIPFGPHLPKHGLSADLLTKVRRTKASDWAYEREYRVEAELTIQDRTTGLYYTEFGAKVDLREVIIGHRCSWSMAKTRELVGKVDRPVRICRARPAFGRFEMVEQRLVRSAVIGADLKSSARRTRQGPL